MLDGIRAVAAIAVLLFHVGNWAQLTLLFPRGYLAVDLFLCLSGFVICSAYEERARGGMTFAEFMRVRCIRLYPMIVLGTFLGFLVYFARDRALGTDLLSPREWFMITSLNLALLPYLRETPLGPSAFPLTVVAWSLFVEVVVNVAWFLVLRRASLIVQGMVMLAAGVAIILLMLRGFSIDDQVSEVDVFGIGLFRGFFSFFLGALIYRFREPLERHSPALRAWPIIAGLALLLAMPVSDGLLLYEGLFLFAVSPALMILSLKAHCSATTLSLCRFGERISYPIYALHRPLLLALFYGFHFVGLDDHSVLYAVIGLPVATIAAALAERYYDRPVRKALDALSRMRRPVPLQGTT